MQKFGQAMFNEIIDQIKNSPRLNVTLTPAKVALFWADVVPSHGMDTASLDVAARGAMDAIASTAATPPSTYIDPVTKDTFMRLHGSFVYVVSAGSGLPASAYGYAVLNDAGTEVLFAERFAEPQPFANNGDGLEVDPRIRLPVGAIG